MPLFVNNGRYVFVDPSSGGGGQNLEYVIRAAHRPNAELRQGKST